MSPDIFCPQCGDKSPVGQKFCEKCGATLPTSAPAGGKAPSPQTTMPPRAVAGGLFDPSRTYYVIKEKFWDWGSGPIYDEKGQEIGKMHRKLLSIRKRIEFQELDGTICAYIARKLIAIKPTYDLHDPDETHLGRFSKTLLSIFRPVFELYDPSGNIICSAQGKFMGFDFKIFKGKSKDDNDLVAEIHKADRWRDIFIGGAFDFSDTYAVKVIDSSIDRKLLLGFVIAIDNVLHDH